MSGGGNSFQNQTSSGVDGNDAFSAAGPSFGDTVMGGGGNGLAISTPVLLGVAAVAVIGLIMWGKK